MKLKPHNMYRTIFLVSLFISLSSGNAAFCQLPAPHNPPRLVNDYMSLLSATDQARLEQKLVAYEQNHSTQIAVVVISDLGGYDIADYSTQLGEAWGVGRGGKENGLLITVVPGQQGTKGEVYIAVGYGLEGVIPDITAKRIIDQEIIPHFQNNQFYQGLDAATTVLMQLAAGEFSAQDYQSEEDVPLGAYLFPMLFIVFFLIMASRQRKAYASPGKSIPFWTLLWLMSHGKSGSQGSFKSFSGGSNFGGSTFKGFGGGRFGGGGARGSW